MTNNLSSPLDDIFGELEREKAAIEQALSAYRDFREKLSRLPPHLAKRAAEAIGQPLENTQSQAAQQRKLPSDSALKMATSLVGKTSLECASQILKDHGNETMHFADIAKEALARGYQGHQPDPEEDANPTAREFRTAQSFWAMMHRSPKKFENQGKGYFRLFSVETEDAEGNKTHATPDAATGTSNGHPSRSLAAQIVAVLQERGQPMRGTDIVEALKKMGVQTGSRLGLGPMVYSTLRKRKKLFKTVDRGVYALINPSRG